MIDLNLLTLYKKKINSYIDENVLTFPTNSDVASLVNPICQYSITIKTGTTPNVNELCKINLLKNSKLLEIKNITSEFRTNANVTFADSDGEYTLNANCDSSFNSPYDTYPLSNAFTDKLTWLARFTSTQGSTPSNVYLNFEMQDLSEIYFYASWNQKQSSKPMSYAKTCDIIVKCNEKEILNTTVSELKLFDRIRIVFDNYNRCHINILNVGSAENM